MGFIDAYYMRYFLSRSLSSINSNKINGLLAEIDLRNYLTGLGYGNRISPGGWIFRSVRHKNQGRFASNHVALFPEPVRVGIDCPVNPSLSYSPPANFQAVAYSLRQIGIESYYCIPGFPYTNRPESVQWTLLEMASPSPSLKSLDQVMTGFQTRKFAYNFLKYSTNVSAIPDQGLEVEFTKELLRVSVASLYMAEISDIDGVFWGNRIAYPLEIKEKMSATDPKIGEYFGLDVGPFTKLAFYAARSGNMESLFIVREITDTVTRNLKEWKFIKFEDIAKYSSWIPQGGGKNMQGGSSSVIKIPADRFSPLDSRNLSAL